MHICRLQRQLSRLAEGFPSVPVFEDLGPLTRILSMILIIIYTTFAAKKDPSYDKWTSARLD